MEGELAWLDGSFAAVHACIRTHARTPDSVRTGTPRKPTGAPRDPGRGNGRREGGDLSRRRGFQNSAYDIMISLDPFTHPPTSPINSPFVLEVKLLTHDQRVQGSIPTVSQPVSTFFPVGPTGKKSGVLGGSLLWPPPPTHPPPSVMAC